MKNEWRLLFLQMNDRVKNKWRHLFFGKRRHSFQQMNGPNIFCGVRTIVLWHVEEWCAKRAKWFYFFILYIFFYIFGAILYLKTYPLTLWLNVKNYFIKSSYLSKNTSQCTMCQSIITMKRVEYINTLKSIRGSLQKWNKL